MIAIVEKKMTAAQKYNEYGGPHGMWAMVVLKDGLTFEGTILDDRLSGIYLLIGGEENRLNIFPWHAVSRVVVKNEEFSNEPY